MGKSNNRVIEVAGRTIMVDEIKTRMGKPPIKSIEARPGQSAFRRDAYPEVTVNFNPRMFATMAEMISYISWRFEMGFRDLWIDTRNSPNTRFYTKSQGPGTITYQAVDGVED